MQDMDALELGIARDVEQGMGPMRSVDAVAIFDALETQRSSRRTFQALFSAARFVVAAGVVALFGGFLLMSVLTNPSGDGFPAAGESASPEASTSHAPDQQDSTGPDPVSSPKEEDVKILRTPLATALAIGLLATPAVPATAQVDLTAAAVVTGTTTLPQEVAAGSRAWTDGAVRGEGVMATQTWEASDPRLSGELSITYNYDFYESLGLFVMAGAVALENDDGRWEGTANYLGGDALQGTTTMLMHGTGTYEGLTSYVVWDENPPTFQAAIFPGDMPATVAGE